MIKGTYIYGVWHSVSYAPNAKAWLIECNGKAATKRIVNLPEGGVTCTKCKRMWQ